MTALGYEYVRDTHLTKVEVSVSLRSAVQPCNFFLWVRSRRFETANEIIEAIAVVFSVDMKNCIT